MTTLGNALMLWAGTALILFAPCYHFATGGRWKNSAMGVHLMSFMGVLGLVMLLAVGNLMAGHGVAQNPGLPPWVRPLVWLLIGGVSWWRLVLLFVVLNEED